MDRLGEVSVQTDGDPRSTILIVEDHEAVRQGLEALLGDEGYRAVSASSGRDALRKATEILPDLVLLDIKMPGMDGFEVCRRMRADPVLAQVPIIVLTAVTDRESRLRGFEVGADDFVTKPFDQMELLVRVRSTIRLNRYRRLLEEQSRRQEAEEDLRKSERFLENVFDAIQDGIHVLDRDLNITHVNQWMEEQYAEKMPLLGKKCYEVFQDRQTPCPWCPSIPAMETGEPQREVTVPHASKNTPVGWLELSAFPLRDVEGRIIGAIEYVKDVTDRKRAEEALRQSEERFWRMAESIQDGLTIIENGRVAYVSDRACEIFGYSREELMELTPLDFAAPEERERLQRVMEQVRGENGDLKSLEYWLIRKDGARRCVRNRYSVSRQDDEVVGRYVVTTDITEQKRSEERVQQHTQELEALNEVAQAITSTLDLGEMLTLITEHATRLMDMAATSVALHDEAKGDVYFAAASGGGANFVVSRRLEMGQGIVGWVVQNSEPALVPDVTKDPRWCEEVDGEIEFTTESILCVPLRSKGRTIGALEAINKKGGFTEDDLGLLSALAAQAAAAIENARLFREVERGREQLQTLSRRLVEVQEAERAYVARELHDETAQALSSLLLNLSLLEKSEACPEPVIEQVVEMEEMVDQMLEDLHRLSVSLHPAALSHLGLTAALEQYVETFTQRYGLETAFEVVGLDGKRLPAEVETALYRIVQEAMTNVARHANATRVDVLVEQRGDQLVTIVEDDGVGFDLETAMASSRLGLLGMRERAEMLGGSLTIESVIGSGTTVFVEVPYVEPDGSAYRE